MVRTIKLVCVMSFILSALMADPVSAVEQSLEASLPVPSGLPAAAPDSAEAPPAKVTNSPTEPAAPPDSMVTLNPDSKPADLVIRNRKILTLRADVAGLIPQLRVSNLQQQFASAVTGEEISDPTVKPFPPYGVVIQINHVNVASIAYLDLDPLGNKTYEQVVAEALKAFSQIVAELREERSAGYMLKAVGFALLATLALALAIGLLVFLRKLLQRFLVSKVETKSAHLTRITRLDFQQGFCDRPPGDHLCGRGL